MAEGQDKTEDKDTLAKGVGVSANAQVHGVASNTELEEDSSAGVDGQAKGSVDGVNADDKGSVGVYEKAQIGGKASVTDHSASVSGGAFAGYGVKAKIGTDLSDGKSGISASTSCSIGPQIGGTGSVSAGIDKDGVVHACLKGDVALGVGLKGDMCVHIDTKAVDNDGKTIVDYANKAWNDTFGKI